MTTETKQQPDLKTPPQSIESEMAVLGSMILDPECLADVFSILKTTDFYKHPHQIIYSAMRKMHDEKRGFDLVIMRDVLKKGGKLEEIGGVDYLIQIADSVPSAVNAQYYARIVKDKALLRQVIKTCGSYMQEAYGYTGDAPDLLSELEASVYRLAEERTTKGPEPIQPAIEAVVRRLEQNKGMPRITGVPTGYFELDEITGGLHPGELVIIAARPSMGKAQPLDSLVLTPDGFVTMGQIKPKDYVIGADGESHRVLAVFPQGIKDVYRVTFTDGASVECCDEHLWFTSTRLERKRGERGSVKSLRDIMETIKIHGDHRNNHHVPWTRPINLPSQELPIDPYLLGIYLGDGSSSGNVIITNPESDIQKNISNRLPDNDAVSVVGMTVRIRRSKKTSYPSDTKTNLKGLGLYGLDSFSKFIPKIYLRGSKTQRLALLRGLCDSDGYVHQPSGVGVEYVTTSPRLADDIIDLVRSLGGSATLNIIEPTFRYKGVKKRGHIAYRINLYFRNGIVPVTSKKHLMKWRSRTRTATTGHIISDVVYVGKKECQCILIDSNDHLYITNDYVPTHNTALGLNIAEHVARIDQKGVLLFSLEMSADELAKRFLISVTGINSYGLRSGHLGDDKKYELQAAYESFHPVTLLVDDSPRLGPMDMLSKARSCQRRYGIDLILVDYMQLMHCPGSNNRFDEVGQISRMMKLMARELRIPVVVMSQLNRGPETREDHRPRMSDLRESGNIEQDADVVLLLFRGDYYEQDKEKHTNIAEVIIGKQRNGPTGSIDLVWRKDAMRFETKTIGD